MSEWTDSQNLGIVRGDPIKGDLEQKPGEPLSDKEVTRRADAQAAHANAEQPDDPTRDELYERATQLDIEGRSSMTKDELADAVDKAEAKLARSRDKAE